MCGLPPSQRPFVTLDENTAILFSHLFFPFFWRARHFAHLALTAFRAASLRSVAVSREAVAFPPFRPNCCAAYPSLARQVRVEGPVELSVEVLLDGSVRDVRVVKGPPLLNQAAIEAVRQWRYQPYAAAPRQDFQWTQVTVNFRLD
ncbi:MAG: energy transducer TonB [Candidatus Angelobacter sp.]